MAIEAGATQAEALVMRSHSALTRFANNEIHQNVAEEDTVVNLRFVDGQRVGVASANRTADDDLRRLAGSAATTARLQPPRSDFVSLPGPRDTPLAAGASAAATAEADPGCPRRRCRGRHRGGRGRGGGGLRLCPDEQRGGLRRQLAGHPRHRTSLRVPRS